MKIGEYTNNRTSLSNIANEEFTLTGSHFWTKYNTVISLEANTQYRIRWTCQTTHVIRAGYGAIIHYPSLTKAVLFLYLASNKSVNGI